MGVYMSSPCIDKISADKVSRGLQYGVSSMQGWRIAQEDAHNCCPDFDIDTNTSFFAVYDGHGGAEVAEYTAKYFPDFLKNHCLYKKGGCLPEALETAFLEFDAILLEDKVLQELKEIAQVNIDDEDENECQDEIKNLCEEATLPIEKLMERFGGKKSQFQSPVVYSKQQMNGDSAENEDCIKERLEDKFMNGQSGQGDSAAVGNEQNGKASIVGQDGDINTTAGNSTGSNGSPDMTSAEASHSPDSLSNAHSSVGGEIASDVISSTVESCSSSAVASVTGVSSSSAKEELQKENATSPSAADTSCSSTAVDSSTTTSGSSTAEGSSTAVDSSTPTSSSTAEGSSSQQCDQPGSSTGRTRNPLQAMMSGDSEDESTTDEEFLSDDSDVEAFLENEDKDSDDSDDDDDDEDDDDEVEDGEENEEYEDVAVGEEPGFDSGCTAVVALKHADQLYVANVGDSRCVLCRDGKALDMSIDHKPEDKLEQTRIENAGGWVTSYGRVKGGLNLSRSLGDHTYKQNESLPARDQMITALPEIKSITLTDKDEFMVLACDGIWNVLNSQEVVTFIHDRLSVPEPKPKMSMICEELFTTCMAPDTTGDGTGCDNMTCIIIKLNDISTSKRSADDEMDKEQDNKRQKVEESIETEGS